MLTYTLGDSHAPAAPIRIFVANLPEVLQDLVAKIVHAQPDMVLVGQARDHVEILKTMRPSVDLLILGAPESYPCPGICSHLLGEFPHLKILVIGDGSDVARAYWLGLRQRKVASYSTAMLLRNLRQLHDVDSMD